MSELEEVKKEWSIEGLSALGIEENLQILKKIYIGQNIRMEGILKFEFEAQKNQISNLLKKGLIKENKWYRHELYLTTEMGSKIVQEYFEKELKVKEEQLLHIMDGIPSNLLRFLLFDYFAKSFSFPFNNEYFLDWRGVLFKDSRIVAGRTQILTRLEKLGLCVKTFSYVSTRGGELRDMHFVISPEIQKKLLTSRQALITGLEYPFRKNCIIFHFLTQRIVSSVKPLGNIVDANSPLHQEMINSLRQEYWNGLEGLNLTEEDIKPIINELAKNGITGEYKGLFYAGLPFVIKDEIGYHALLEKMLIDPVLSYLCEERAVGKIEEKEAEKKVPPNLISKEGRLNFFDELGNFEIKLRDFIASRLGKNLQQSKDEKLMRRLKERKKEDEIFGLQSEPLINYVTFGEYVTIICSNWETFGKHFTNEEEVKISLRWINILARRPLAHFRALTKTRIERTRDEVKKFLQKIGKAD